MADNAAENEPSVDDLIATFEDRSDKGLDKLLAEEKARDNPRKTLISAIEREQGNRAEQAEAAKNEASSNEDTEALAQKVAELEARLSQPQQAAPAKRFTIARAPSSKDARKEIEAKRTGKMKTYRALSAGTDYREGFIPAGRVFTTDQPQGEWMEPVKGEEEPTTRNQFAVGPDLNARLRDMVQDGDIADKGKRPRQAKEEA